MQGVLTTNQIEYVLFHWKHSVDLNVTLRKQFHFVGNNEKTSNKSGIIFKLSSHSFNIEQVFNIDDLPILFPLNTEKSFYKIENGNLIFNHDILKSCFYLLSGYQEWKNKNTDHWGRFKYENSLQQRLKIAHKPIVNYYFQILSKAFEEYAKLNGLRFNSKSIIQKPALCLSHDIDKVDYYTVNRLLYKIKELLGLVNSSLAFNTNLRMFFRIAIQLLRFKGKDNPNWNFEYLRKVEREQRFRSVFFFLHKDVKNADSNYKFREKRMVPVFNCLNAEKCEIGLHGNVKSVENVNSLEHFHNELSLVSPQPVIGIRQHRLLYKLPETAKFHEAVGLKYDSSLGFAEHEGFRNSYCLPFRLYDFENDRMMDVWELPLNVMDVTLFHYRKLNFKEARNSIFILLDEIEKFNGILSVLWHNDFFDEQKYPGVTVFYEKLLQQLANRKVQSLTGKEIIEKWKAN